jgi:phosphoribosylamine---glycine ligase
VKVLVVGSGGREHALAWKLVQSQKVERVICVPGNGGTARLPRCENLPLSIEDFAAVRRYALVNGMAMVVVGPEVPLALGLADYLQAEGVPVFGPCQAGAQIEASKSWAKALMQSAGIPTPQAASFTAPEPARAYVLKQGAPIVIKADGLAAGKGVTVATTLEAAFAAIDAAFEGQFGVAGERVLIEEYLQGQEISVLALTDGITIRPLLPAQDHKRIGEGDTGANTGGMGAYAPVPLATPALMERIQREILQPTLTALQAEGIDYRGVLYAGLMISPAGDPQVIEFNCRFGDPETQVILPLLETPLPELLLACVHQKLEQQPAIAWKPEVAVCVVMAAGGYPGPYQKGIEITGIDRAEATGALVFHAGTRLQKHLVSDGGRVLSVTACGQDFGHALDRVYAAIREIKFQGSYYRRDIGYRVRSRS